MFDIGFSEMLIIAIVALVVIGPERLPKVARTAGHLLGRLQRYVRDVKSDINREMQLEELRKLQSEIQESARSVEQSLKQRNAGCVRQAVEPDGGSGQRRPEGAGGARAATISATGRCHLLQQCRSQRRARRPIPANRVERPDLSDEPTRRFLPLAPGRVARPPDHGRWWPSVLVFICLFPWAKELYALLAQPLLATLPQGGQMIATDVIGVFLVPMKVALMVAFLIALPYVLYQVWAFVAPGLYAHEKRLALPLVAASVLLFFVGMAFAYFLVFPTVFGFMATVAPEGVAWMTDIEKYLSFVLTTFIAFGVTFEVPVVVLVLV
jgi:Tat protein translocase TatC/Tat protein translocase TatB subunit